MKNKYLIMLPVLFPFALDAQTNKPAVEIHMEALEALKQKVIATTSTIPLAEAPVAEKPSAKEVVVKPPAVETSVFSEKKEIASEKPVAEKSVVDSVIESFTFEKKTPIVEATVAEPPATKEPVLKPPAVETLVISEKKETKPMPDVSLPPPQPLATANVLPEPQVFENFDSNATETKKYEILLPPLPHLINKQPRRARDEVEPQIPEPVQTLPLPPLPRFSFEKNEEPTKEKAAEITVQKEPSLPAVVEMQKTEALSNPPLDITKAEVPKAEVPKVETKALSILDELPTISDLPELSDIGSFLPTPDSQPKEAKTAEAPLLPEATKSEEKQAEQIIGQAGDGAPKTQAPTVKEEANILSQPQTTTENISETPSWVEEATRIFGSVGDELQSIAPEPKKEPAAVVEPASPAVETSKSLPSITALTGDPATIKEEAEKKVQSAELAKTNKDEAQSVIVPKEIEKKPVKSLGKIKPQKPEKPLPQQTPSISVQANRDVPVLEKPAPEEKKAPEAIKPPLEKDPFALNSPPVSKVPPESTKPPESKALAENSLKPPGSKTVVPVGKIEGTIEFEKNEGILPPSSSTMLDKLADRMKSDQSLRTTIVAYAQKSSESNDTSRRISLSRALAIRSYLIEKGVKSLNIVVQAQGANVPSGKSDRADIFVKPSGG